MVRIANETIAPSQTLDRGLICLEFVAASDRPVSIAATATHLGVHRSIVYRLLRTLEHRHLVVDQRGREDVAILDHAESPDRRRGLYLVSPR